MPSFTRACVASALTLGSLAASGLALASLVSAAAQDRNSCAGIYCAQGAAASDYAAELTPLMVDPAKTWEEVRGRNALVIKYYHPDGNFASERIWPQAQYMKPVTTMPARIAFAGAGTPTVVLHGLTPCTRHGSFDYKGERFTCATIWQDRLGAQLFATQVVLCRAYLDQIDKAIEEATCIRQTSGFGPDRSVGGVVIEDQLAGSGIVSLVRDKQGRLLRPDLAEEAERGAAILDGAAQ